MTGRWPANVILSPDMAETLDGQSGISKGRREYTGRTGGGKDNGTMYMRKPETVGTWPEDPGGGASRFFLTAGYEPWELEWIIANGLTPCGE